MINCIYRLRTEDDYELVIMGPKTMDEMILFDLEDLLLMVNKTKEDISDKIKERMRDCDYE